MRSLPESAGIRVPKYSHGAAAGPIGAFVPHRRPFVPRVLASAAMGILSRVESFLERFLEAPAGRLGASIQPVSLAKRIERAMDTNKTYADVGVIVPNQYDLYLHPSDFDKFASYRASLEDDLAHGVLARARHERYTLVAPPPVPLRSG